MNVESGFAQVGEARLYYEVAGAGAPLVLIHGFGLDTRVWADQFERFARTYRVVRYDLRGFGRSSPVDGRSYSPAADLAGLLEQLNIEHAHIVGLSLGGWVAVNFALAYPALVDRLVLADAVLLGMAWSQEYLDDTNPAWAAATEKGVDAAKKLVLRSRLYAGAMGIATARPRMAQMMADYSGWHFLNADPTEAEADVLERLQTISAPTLVLIGEQDYVDFHAIADRLTAIPGARKVVLTGVGHLTNMEAPERFNELVLGFLAG